MKEHPILMSTPIVQAILAGRKTQTRRIRGFERINEKPDQWRRITPDVYPGAAYEGDFYSYCDFGTVDVNTEYMALGKCWQGQVGDVLWVKETFWQYGRWVNTDNPKMKRGKEWHALPGQPILFEAVKPVTGLEWSMGYEWRKMSSLFLKKEQSRIYLEITDIRVERAQEISEEDACAEGIGGDQYDELWEDYSMGNDPERFRFTEPSESFQSLWQKINGPESWKANPWVWAITFNILSTTGKPGSI